MNMTFGTTLFISFHQVDAAGVLFFGHAFTIAHQTFEQFITQQLQISWQDWFQNSNWIVPIIHTQASYRHPLTAGSNCQIKLEVTAIRHSSFQISYEFNQDCIPCCQIQTTHVFCDKKTKQKIDIPIQIREALDKYLLESVSELK